MGNNFLKKLKKNLLKFQKFGEEKNFERIKQTLVRLYIHQDTYYNVKLLIRIR